MINLSRVVRSRRFQQSFTVTRKNAAYDSTGTFTPTVITLQMSGIINPFKSKETLQMPQGDLLKGAIEIFTTEPLQGSHLDTSTTGSMADEITWKGTAYKVFQGDDYSDYGYFYNIAIRKQTS